MTGNLSVRRDLLTLRILATGALVATAGVGAIVAGWTSAAVPVRWGLVLGLVLAVPSYWSLSWALWRSNGVFFGVFGIGLLVRLVGLLGGVWAVGRSGSLELVPFALSAAGALAGLSIIEVFFIGRQNRLPQ